MNLKSSNKIDKNRYELEIEVDAAEFEKAVEKSYQKESKKITVPGFRKGKAPRSFIEKCYGPAVFYDNAINQVYPYALEDAVKEANLEVVGDDIDLNIVEVGKNGLIFKAAVTVKPEVKIEGYKGLEAKSEPVEVTEKDIDAEIEKVRQRNARIITVEDRPAENGDIAVIDFEGFCDGVAFEGGKANNHSLNLGDGQFIPGFEEQIVGHNAGDEFDITVKFPEEYQAENLKGKEAVFKIKLHEIKKTELPEIDDEFAKDISEFDTIEAYKEDLKANLLKQYEQNAKNEIENQLINKLIELLEADIPESMIKRKVKDSIREFGYKLESQGLDMKSYMQYTGMDEAKLEESFAPQAERQIKVRLALEAISKLENLQATEKDLEDEYESLSKQYNMDIENIKSIIPKEELLKDIAIEKAMNFVHENAVIA